MTPRPSPGAGRGHAARARGHAAPLLLAAAVAASCSGGKYLEDFAVEPPKPGAAFSQPEQVTAGNESSFAPDLSPNGEYVVYTSDRKGNMDVWEKRAAGGFARPITLHSADDFSPVISPDGKKIAFVSRRANAAGEIHVINESSFSLGRLVGQSEGDVLDIASPLTEATHPSWFPDSQRLVFAARAPGEKTPQLMAADLADLKPVPLGDNRGDQPAVSPDGKQVAYVRGGALYVYRLDTDRAEQLTDGGALQDGQPRFTQDGAALVFIRYADDTSGDGKLDGDDRPTVWRLDLARPRDPALRETYALEPLTSATFAAYSPQLRGPYLYVALQTSVGLNIFRLPAAGQLAPGRDLGEIKRQFDAQNDYYDKAYVLRRGEVALARAGQPAAAAEAALLELDWAVQNGHAAEAAWVHAKLRANFKGMADVVALSDLALVTLALAKVEYPRYAGDLTPAQVADLAALQKNAEALAQPFAQGGAGARRVAARALLLRAKILAAQRHFFEANKLLASLLASYGDDRALAAEASLYAAVLTPATSDADAGIRALREVVTKYADHRDVVLRASQAAVALLDGRSDRLEALVALRTDAKGLPVMPALAHMRIADLYRERGLEAVAVNELRQIVDLYPESPEIMLDAAGRLAPLEVKAGRFDAAEAMLGRLTAALKAAPPEHRARAQSLQVEFLLTRGEEFLRQKAPDLALAQFERVLALEPQNVAGHRGKIDAASQSQALAALTAAYRAQAAAAPESAELLYAYGYARTYDIDAATSLRSRLGAIDDAIALVEAARQLNGQLLHVHQTLGWLYMQKNFTLHEYWRGGSWLAGADRRTGIVKDFFGAGDPDWRELAIDAYQNAYYLSRAGSLDRAGLALNLGQAYFALKNYQKSLAYYLQRVKLLPVNPMRDARAEAILLDRAGRSAFQTDELELAESLQRSALTAWETVNNAERIAYAIDALALTLRERGKYKEAITLYERLERTQERIGARGNRVATLSNLGYCAFQDAQLPQALSYFAQAETELASVQATADVAAEADDAEAPRGKDAIKVDLGGQASAAAQGFDLFGRHVLILTFRAKIYEKLGRLDLALATYEAKLALLKDGQDKDGRSVAEEIAVLENNLGELRLAAGYHQKARAAFRAAEAAARTLKPGDQAFKSPGEVLNDINRARVELRLASLGVLAKEDVDASVKDLDATAAGLRPIYRGGATAEGKPLAELISLSSSLRAAIGPPGDDGRLSAGLTESLAIMKTVDVPREAMAGPLLALNDALGGGPVPALAPASVAPMPVTPAGDSPAGAAPRQETPGPATPAGDGPAGAAPRQETPAPAAGPAAAAEPTPPSAPATAAGPTANTGPIADAAGAAGAPAAAAGTAAGGAAAQPPPPGAQAAGGAGIGGLVSAFKQRALASPALEWKVLASDGDFAKAFEALDRFVAGGGWLRSPPDRQTAREVFERLLAGDAVKGDPAHLALLVRRYQLVRAMELAQRGGLDPARARQLLALKSAPLVLAALGEHDAVLTAHRTLKGQLYLFLQDKRHLTYGAAPLAALTAEAVAVAIAGSGIAAALPPPGGRLYLVPTGELYDVPWETVVVAGGGALGQRGTLAFLPAVDVLPDVYAARRLPKSSLGYVGGAGVPAAAEAAVRTANPTRDVTAVALDGAAPLGAKLTGFDLVHADAPLYLNDVEPERSSLLTGRAAAGDGSRHLNDLTLAQLAGLRLGETTALIFANTQRDNPDLRASGEGHDGWVFVALAATLARVPSVLLVERPPPSAAAETEAAPAALPGPAVDWARFYLALGDQPVGEAARAAAVPGRLLGYPGIPGGDEVSYAKEHLDKAVDEAEDAKADQDFDAAASAYKRALAYAERLGSAGGAVDKLLTGVVTALYQKHDYEGALHYKRLLLAKLKPLPKGVKPKTKDEDKDPVEYGKAVTDAAVLAVRAMNADGADVLLAEAERIFTDEDEPLALAKVWNYRGINRENQGRYEETVVAYQTAQAIYAKASRPDEAASQLLNIANVYRNDLSDYAAALDYYAKAAAEFKRLGKLDLYLPLLIDKANTHMAIGELETATYLLEQEVLPALDPDKQRVLWVRATQILASAYYRAGLYQEAKDLNDRTLAAAAKIEPKAARLDRQLDAIGLRGMIQAKLGRYREAFDDFRGAIGQATEVNNKPQIALLYNNYGFWAREYGAVDQSIEFFNIAQKLDEELKSRSGVAFDQRNMGLSIILKGDYGRARDLLTRALKTSDELHLVYNAAYCDFGLGDVAMREAKWGEAQGHFQKTLAVSERGSMQDFVWRAHAGIGGALQRQGKAAEAEASYARAVTVIETLRAGLKSEDSRNAFYSDVGVQEVYEAYAGVLMGLGRTEAAWQAAERARSRAFIDALGTQKLRLANAASVRLLAEEKKRKAAVEDVLRRIGQNSAAAGPLAGERQAAEAAYDELLKRMHAADAQLPEFVRVSAISKEELAAAVGPDTAVVEYLVTPDALLIWVLQGGRITGKRVAVPQKELLGRIRDFRVLMENYSSTDYLGKELADLLLAPVQAELSAAKRLAIVPHGALHFLPFAALPLNADEALMDRYAVYYLEAATVARFARAGLERPLGATTRILALANPATPADLPDLPFAGKEVDVIGRYFPHVTLEEGAAATAASVERLAGSVDVLHIAAHGEFKPAAPAESQLLLAPEGKEGGGLSVGRVFGMTTTADLVVLSACDTALGRLSAGDEIISLDRAFFYAGANSVVSSLWRISDVASAVTMKRFYRYLAEGKDKAEALRQAQLLVRRYFKHPAYWSAFRLLGDYR